MRLKTKFQDEDFDLGEVVNANIYYGGSDRIKIVATSKRGGEHSFYYESLKELSEMFEDAPEEPEEWYINEYNEPEKVDFGFPIDDIESLREIGFLFKTEKETNLAIRKCKAWKRLKDKGFRFTGWYSSGDTTNTIRIYAEFPDSELGPIVGSDLDLLFQEVKDEA